MHLSWSTATDYNLQSEQLGAFVYQVGLRNYYVLLMSCPTVLIFPHDLSTYLDHRDLHFLLHNTRSITIMRTRLLHFWFTCHVPWSEMLYLSRTAIRRCTT